MKKTLIAVGLIFVTLMLLWLLSQPKAGNPANIVATNESRTAVGITNEPNVSRSDDVQQSRIPPVTRPLAITNDAEILALSARDFYEQTRIDPKLEWKMPINFWGRVVDESNNPVAGTDVHFVWNDLSANGTTEINTMSGEDGFFSLVNQRGKGLSINVEKDGYYRTSSSRQSFEYAQPEGRFYPDQGNPVVFRLRKKHEGAELTSKSVEIRVEVGKTTSLQLDDYAVLQVELLTNAPMSARQWATKIRIVNGGIQPALDEFPFEAPLDDYQIELDLDYDTPKPPTWIGNNLYQGGQFYVKTATVYGRIELKMISGKSFMRITSFLNPTGSRNLEPAN